MVTLSAFGDEVASDLIEQMDVLEREDIRYIELRGVWRKGVLRLGDAQLDDIEEVLEERDFGISAIGSPIGKIGILEDFDPHVKDFRRALDIAGYLGCEYVRVFSFYLPKGDDPAMYRDEVMQRMSLLVELAEEAGIVLLHENEQGIYGDTAERCRDVLDTVASPFLKVNFDAANFIQVGQRPYEESFPLLKDDIAYLHIKDARLADRVVLPAGEGDARFPEIFSELVENGFEGFLCIEPHLSGDPKKAFRRAARALKDLLDDLGVDYA